MHGECEVWRKRLAQPENNAQRKFYCALYVDDKGVTWQNNLPTLRKTVAKGNVQLRKWATFENRNFKIMAALVCMSIQ